MSHERVHTLTCRETEVLRLMAQGERNQDIATSLGIGQRTIKMHVARVMDKLGARNRLHAVALAVGRGLVT